MPLNASAPRRLRGTAPQKFPCKQAGDGESFMRGDMKFLLPYGFQRHRPCCWKPYWKYDITHGVCCAHLLRELLGVQENQPEPLAADFSALLMHMKRRKEGAIAEGKDDLEPDILGGISSSYDAFILKAYQKKIEPEKEPKKHGRPKRGKLLALIDRLRDYKASVCLFAENCDVPFDNNQAECDLRMVKVKTKVSGGFRTESGARLFLKIMSYIGTARKQAVDTFQAIKAALGGAAAAR